jgi:hypothetical protein
MSQNPNVTIAVIGIGIGKNSFHVVGHRRLLRPRGERPRDRPPHQQAQ